MFCMYVVVERMKEKKSKVCSFAAAAAAATIKFLVKFHGAYE